MFRLVIFALLPIVLSVGADAQTASQTDYDAAILAFESGDTREAVRLAERSVAEADTPADRTSHSVPSISIRRNTGCSGGTKIGRFCVTGSQPIPVP